MPGSGVVSPKRTGRRSRAVPLNGFPFAPLLPCLDSLGIDRVPIVAHSMGGHWSQWFAMDRSDRATALALLGVPGNVLPHGHRLPCASPQCAA
jgi:2-hydroxy-6-oxonona-2,4-dienedioate hydrolase